jgi:hypothetical protein
MTEGAVSAMDRRGFLKMGSIGAAAVGIAPTALLAAERRRDPPDVGRKFGDDGRVLPFAGNTIICHLPQQGADSAAFDVMLDFYRMAPSRNYGPKIALLPPSSYHMTVVGGATHVGREAGQWPAGVPADASIDTCNRVLGERLQAARLAPIPAIRMKVDARDSGYDGNTLRIPLSPVDQGETDRLETLRATLSRIMGLAAPKPGAYQFHMTLAYLIAPFDPAERSGALNDMAQWKARLADRAPVIRLGAPEYCVFADMFAFKRQFYLGAER